MAALGLRSGIGVAAGVLAIVALVLAGGCSSEAPPPATVREFTEPTETVDQAGVTPEESSEATGGPLSPELRHQLESQVEVLEVGYGADGAYLTVYFLAPPRLAIFWQPGEMYVVDEATGAKYDDIPFMPKIGRLIGRPVLAGQEGYVILENKPPLAAGSKVTVVLGGVMKKGVPVQETTSPVPTQ